MSAMYKAIQVTKPGEFAAVMKPLVDPGPGQVRIRVEASGVCHSDAGTVEGSFPIDWRASLGTRWSGGSMPLALASRAGRLVSASVSASSEALAVIANSVEMAIS